MSDQLDELMQQQKPESEALRKTDLKSMKKEHESSELLNLLKKTQSQVNSLENEITRVEAENIHQEWGFLSLSNAILGRCLLSSTSF